MSGQPCSRQYAGNPSSAIVVPYRGSSCHAATLQLGDEAHGEKYTSSVMILRHALAIAILPLTATVLIPIWIARSSGAGWSWPSDPTAIGIVFIGFDIALIGLVLMAASIAEFATRGKGTLAPWDPPRHLVVRGAYRFVRNPMISGVILVLVGEAMMLRSAPHTLWAAAFAIANAIYIPLFEEPALEARFGDDYRRYKESVRRFVPRLRPWE